MIRCYLPAIVLVVVALVQRYLMQYQQLDPWKGGGFGMFSAISARSLRQMTIVLIPTDREEKRFPPSHVANRIPLDGYMRSYRSRLLTMPRPAMLQRLADRLAKSEWVAVQPRSATSDETLAANDPQAPQQTGEGGDRPTIHEYYRMKRDVAEDAPIRPLPLREVRVEVWEYRLNSESNQLELTRLAVASSRSD